MRWHNLPHRHRIVCHTRMHAVTQSAIQGCTRLHAVTYAATHTVSATRACMQLQNPPHMHDCTALSATQAGCMQSHIRLHMLYLPHKHEYICIICPTRMHVVAYSAHRLYLPHRHEYICTICHTGMHTVSYPATQAVSATHACMQAHNLPPRHALHYPPHWHACSGTICHTCGCTICHILLY